MQATPRTLSFTYAVPPELFSQEVFWYIAVPSLAPINLSLSRPYSIFHWRFRASSPHFSFISSLSHEPQDKHQTTAAIPEDIALKTRLLTDIFGGLFPLRDTEDWPAKAFRKRNLRNPKKPSSSGHSINTASHSMNVQLCIDQAFLIILFFLLHQLFALSPILSSPLDNFLPSLPKFFSSVS